MMTKKADSYLFETSWEVCNKVGGIYTVISTKVGSMQRMFGDRYFLIGPDVWKDRDNREFIEDKKLYEGWRAYAESQGVSFRVGRWNTEGKPVVVLVDFMSLIARKDAILSDFWNDFQLDSLSGQWDYIEPVLFGYAAARVVETFYNYTVFPQEKVYAHFHEWMTGSGVLYLKKQVPAVATVFTTHATVLGRCIAGNALPLYGALQTYNGEELSHKFGVRAKFSMEKLSALHADAFTTVSRITDRECLQFFGKGVDKVTPNGFEDRFVPQGEAYETKRREARQVLRRVSEALLNVPVSEDAFFVLNSGRYEFKNKGIDLYIDALAQLNRRPDLNRQVIAFIAVPSGHAGAREDLRQRLQQEGIAVGEAHTDDFSTHYLSDSEHDPVLNRLRLDDLHNRTEDKVKVIFVPCYLDGTDGIFNLSYYDFLTGFDASVFPSYYEPWGYTPLESAAFSLPTMTTSVAGFGLWVQESVREAQQGVVVVDRNDSNDPDVVARMVEQLCRWTALSAADMAVCRKQAYAVSRQALWQNLVEEYATAYDMAADKWNKDATLLNKELPFTLQKLSAVRPILPQWRKLMIRGVLPEALSALERLAENLWWSWQPEGTALFESVDPGHWEACGHNPVALLDGLSAQRIKALMADTDFMARLAKVYADFEAYMAEGAHKTGPKVAYFSMEFGLHESLKIYSGGLGILAGDYLKSASDKNVDMVGIGLLYRYGYFQQRLNAFGEQQADYIPQAFSKLPILPVRDEDGLWKTVQISLPGRQLTAKLWLVNVGRVPLYLLDTDIEENTPADRSITHQLYGGDWENRFKQELLLGVGGVRVLRCMGLHPEVYHCNEGHGAFMGLERLREYVEDENLPFLQAEELVRSATLFTTHTPVPAGHDAFSEDIMRTYMSSFPGRLKIEWEQFMALGQKDDESAGDKFSMSFLAANLSEEINGVSRIHGRVSREIFAPMYPGYYPEELENIGYVTNGVHYRTWAHPLWQQLYEKHFGADFGKDVSNADCWAHIQNVPDEEVWRVRTQLRARLIAFVKERLQAEMPSRGDTPQEMVKVLSSLDPSALTFGFARRFATYKRAYLLLSNLDRLAKIVGQTGRPVQFIFAGKAHPADKAGQDLIKQIIEVSRRPEFRGKIIFIENYDIDVARYLVQGVDVWINTPTRPLEASGTSGEKAIMNGVLNLSVLDGWWAEGYRPGAGWALKEEQTYENPVYQNQLDAETIYDLIENEIVPAYYAENGAMSPRWIQYIKNNIAQIAPHFTMRRQLDDYYKQYYHALAERSHRLSADHYREASALALWRLNVINRWDGVRCVDVQLPETSQGPLALGEDANFGIRLDLGGLKPEDIGVEVIFGSKENDVVRKILFTQELTPTDARFDNPDEVNYTGVWPVDVSGVYDYAFRIYPKHPGLVHRQDIRLVKWF